ncbi:MAG: DUF559 domain-containing protein [Bacteroidetes bacterium]|nr:DUF559 domain-containing protein [Bacteroidota bacterium]
MDLKIFIDKLRKRIQDDHYEFQEMYPPEKQFEFLDDFINADGSDLEKAFFLMLNQFPGDKKDYFVRPREMVLIPDIYDLSAPGIEYEIDFALYGGSIDNPMKVAIDCDGIRSHRQKHSNKDRRKDVNLQASGWLVMRFGSKEIHEELLKFEKEETYICDFITSIDNVIKEKLKLISWDTYARSEYRSKLTGFKWDWITCKHCTKKQMGVLNRKKHTCRHCGTKFIRDIHPTEKIKYEHGGLLFFED